MVFTLSSSWNCGLQPTCNHHPHRKSHFHSRTSLDLPTFKALHQKLKYPFKPISFNRKFFIYNWGHPIGVFRSVRRGSLGIFIILIRFWKYCPKIAWFRYPPLRVLSRLKNAGSATENWRISSIWSCIKYFCQENSE